MKSELKIKITSKLRELQKEEIRIKRLLLSYKNKPIKPFLPNQTIPNKLNQTYQTIPTKPNLHTKPTNQTYKTKLSKPFLPNQTYLTKPTKPNLLNRNYQTKPTKPNPPNLCF